MNETHSNNFGALRLLFAVMVIFSHSGALISNNEFKIFGHETFGSIAVDGFFLISGYLITKSWQSAPAPSTYVISRILRIYPGYVVAFLLCMFLAPFVGGSGTSVIQTIKSLILLEPPFAPGVFQGSSYPSLNGSMWTIAYEFRCYVLVAAIGFIGAFGRREIIVAAALLALCVSATRIELPPVGKLAYVIGDPEKSLRLTGVFLCGSAYYLFGDRIVYGWRMAALAFAMMVAGMTSQALATPAVAVFGGYVLFWFAFAVPAPILAKIGAKTDLSYGIYLYAWPIQNLIVWFDPVISPMTLSILATVAAALVALASWRFVEKPAMSLKRKLTPEPGRGGRGRGREPLWPARQAARDNSDAGHDDGDLLTLSAPAERGGDPLGAQRVRDLTK
jgi:peptidoglycan/LPS O-acetylase OafA/YrhL